MDVLVAATSSHVKNSAHLFLQQGRKSFIVHSNYITICLGLRYMEISVYCQQNCQLLLLLLPPVSRKSFIHDIFPFIPFLMHSVVYPVILSS